MMGLGGGFRTVLLRGGDGVGGLGRFSLRFGFCTPVLLIPGLGLEGASRLGMLGFIGVRVKCSDPGGVKNKGGTNGPALMA